MSAGSRARSRAPPADVVPACSARRRRAGSPGLGDGIGERNAEFDQVRSAAFERGNERSGAVGRGIAGGDVGDQRGTALPCLSRSKSAANASHLVEFLDVLSVDVGIFVAAAGEVHDEDLALGCRCAASASATACADSSAGMMPSVRARNCAAVESALVDH